MKLDLKIEEEKKEELLLLKYGIKNNRLNDEENCGGKITDFETFESPGFELGAYFDNLNCIWEIDLGEQVTSFRIEREEFEIEHKDDCGYDFVKVLN
jgi:hypothetical protein